MVVCQVFERVYVFFNYNYTMYHRLMLQYVDNAGYEFSVSIRSDRSYSDYTINSHI
jgi:hypothetical protein